MTPSKKGVRPGRRVREDQTQRRGESRELVSGSAVQQVPSPPRTDTAPSPATESGIGALEYEDLRADARDTAPAASDLSPEEAVKRLKNARRRR